MSEPSHNQAYMALASTIAKAIFRVPIVIYRYCVSPFTPASCRHLPTCSEYAEQAIDKNGAWKGSWLTLSRLLRCHPWGSHGLDPVPNLTDVHHPFAPWKYGRWNGHHIKHKFHE